jgi:hypothetical protein
MMLETAQDQIKKTIAACGNPRDWSLEQIGDEITFSYVCPGDTEPTEFAGSSLREVLDAAASPRNVVDLRSSSSSMDPTRGSGTLHRGAELFSS